MRLTSILPLFFSSMLLELAMIRARLTNLVGGNRSQIEKILSSGKKGRWEEEQKLSRDKD